LYCRLFSWLKPGGTLLITDYCCGSSSSPESYSEGFRSYIQERGYSLLPLDTYKQQLSDAGFENVTAEDRTEAFLQTLEEELGRLEGLEGLEEDARRVMVQGWKAKVDRARSGEQLWGLFMAKKPVH
jgi:phosphoethanolamine N-methyltransferase